MLEISTLIKVEHDGEKILFTEEADSMCLWNKWGQK
jgi:hypothetical protein